MHFKIIKLTLILTFVATCVIGQESDLLFVVKLHLIDFDRTAAQVINGENNKRMANKQPLLIFSYNLMKLADREVLKLVEIDKISTPDLNTILNMKNVIAKVDKYSSFVDTSNKS